MYKLLITLLVISILGVGLLVADLALQVSKRVNTRNIELHQMLTGIDK